MKAISITQRSIISAARGSIEPDGFPVDSITQMIETIIPLIPKTTQLWVPNNIWKFYTKSFLEVSPELVGNQLVISIKLKIVERDVFEFFKITHVRFRISHNSHAKLASSNEILVLNIERTKATTLSHMAAQQCLTNGYCHLHTYYYLKNDFSKNLPCSIAYFFSKNLDNCVIEFGSNKIAPSVKEISTGKFLITTRETQTFTSVCEYESDNIIVNIDPPHGILTLPKGCRAQSSEIIINTLSLNSTTMYLEPLDFNISEIEAVKQTLENFKTITRKIIKFHSWPKIVNFVDKSTQNRQDRITLNDIKESLDEPVIEWNNTFHQSLNYFNIVIYIVIVVSLLIIYVVYKRKQHKNIEVSPTRDNFAKLRKILFKAKEEEDVSL